MSVLKTDDGKSQKHDHECCHFVFDVMNKAGMAVLSTRGVFTCLLFACVSILPSVGETSLLNMGAIMLYVVRQLRKQADQPWP